MPIRPRHARGEGRPPAGRQFVDRDDLIGTFRSALARTQPDRHRVLVFYGVGGIGKTSLRKELMRQLESEPGVVTAALDFGVPGYRDEETALFVLRKLLHDKYKVQFPSFDIAYAVHWRKTRPQTPMTRQNFPLLESGTMLSEAIDVLGNVTLVGVIPKIAGMALKGSQVVRDWWTRRGSSELRDLPMLEAPQVAEQLPMFWAADLRDFLVTRGMRAALFLDTYEALTETERSEGKLYQQDEWVRELVAQLPEVLWVVCGREMLRWAELDADWKESLDQQLVGGLADEDARQFLRSCGIENRAIADKIVKGSTGLPYYLDLAVDTYVEARLDGLELKPESFAHAPAEVFTRFLRNLTQPEIETLKVLAVPRFWSYEVLELLVTKFNTGYPLTAFSDLCRFSFINEDAAAGTWTMQQLMRQSLQEHAAADLVKRVHRVLFEHYDRQLKEVDIRNITDRQRNVLTEAFYHGRAALSVPEFAQWFEKPAEQFFRAAQYRLLLPLYAEVAHHLERELGPEHPAVATGLNNLAGVLYKQGMYAEAEPLQRRALAIREKSYGPAHPDVAECLNNLAAAVYAEGRYAEAEPLYRRSLSIVSAIRGPDHPDTAFPLDNLAVTLQGLGRYAEAEPLYRRSLSTRERRLGTEHPDVAKTLNDLAALLHAEGKYDEAEPLYRRALAIREKKLGPAHPAVARSLTDLAELLHARGSYAEAEPLARRSLEITEQTLGPEHPDVARSLTSLADRLQSQGRYPEAEPLRRRAIAVREKALGPEHPQVANSLNNLASLLNALGRSAEAEPLYRRALAVKERALGPNHRDVAESLCNIAALLHDQGRYPEAESLLRRALAIDEQALGPDHPDVAASLNNLATVLREQGRYAEAESLLRRCVAMCERALGLEHVHYSTAMNNLAELLERQGRHQEAEPLFLKSLAAKEKALGPEHPEVARGLSSLAGLLHAQGRDGEAEPFFRRALAIEERAFGPCHPDIAPVLDGLADLCERAGRNEEARLLRSRAEAVRTGRLTPPAREL